MAKTNQEILEQIESTSTAEYQSRVSELGELSRTGVEMVGLFDEYPTAKNEFINYTNNYDLNDSHILRKVNHTAMIYS